MDLCRRSKRNGLSSTSNSIYDLSSQHSSGTSHLSNATNTAGAVANSNRLMMANLAADNSNIAALAFNNHLNAALNSHV